MKRWLAIFGLIIPPVAFGAPGEGWQPPAGHAQEPIWPGAAPDGFPVSGPETVTTTTYSGAAVAGKPVVLVGNVSRPTMTVYPAQGINTGIAVLVFPGGGYWNLAIDLEGTEVCDWLASRGITAVLLKYRVPGSGAYSDSAPKSGPYPKWPQALEVDQRTLGLVRLRAAEWKVDPHKIGVMGFSAGGHLSAAASIHFDHRIYPLVDEADRQSCRPDFAVLLYPGHIASYANPSAMNPDIRIPPHAPPAFIVHNEDDPVDDPRNSLDYCAALKDAGVPAEMHLFAQGGHAFGIRRTRAPSTGWPELFETWLQTMGLKSP